MTSIDATSSEAADHGLIMPMEPARKPRRLLRLSHGVTLLVLALGIVWFFTLRPTLLGDPATYVMVSGVSMEPTYKDGDMVILRDSSRYEPGDIVAYHVPEGEVGAGAIVIHRVAGSDELGYITKGDNRKGEDLWRPVQADVLGEAWLHLPEFGDLLARLRAPLPLAAIATIFTVYFVLTWSKPQRRPGSRLP